MLAITWEKRLGIGQADAALFFVSRNAGPISLGNVLFCGD
jgi:hypothetical protein